VAADRLRSASEALWQAILARPANGARQRSLAPERVADHVLRVTHRPRVVAFAVGTLIEG